MCRSVKASRCRDCGRSTSQAEASQGIPLSVGAAVGDGAGVDVDVAVTAGVCEGSSVAVTVGVGVEVNVGVGDALPGADGKPLPMWASMMPFAPTAQAFTAPEAATAQRSSLVPERWACQ